MSPRPPLPAALPLLDVTGEARGRRFLSAAQVGPADGLVEALGS